MAHFAKLDDNNMVVEVLKVNNEDMTVEGMESEQAGIEYLESIGFSGRWIQTSYNNNFRKNYAAVGGYYDEEKDAFIPIKLFPSWTLNEETCKWEPPTPMPIDEEENTYFWDEETLSWKGPTP